MYGNTITLFNLHKGTGLWYTTVFNDADLIGLRASGATQHGVVSGDAVEIIIHTRADKSALSAQGPKRYAGPKAFAGLTDPGSYFTFTPEVDFFVAGDQSSPDPLADEEYESGLYHALNDELDGVYMVTSATFYPLLPHFEIGGK